MTDILFKLQALESIFKEANAPILQHFNPGLSEEEIRKFFTDNNMPIHFDLIALYQWHNGVKSVYGLLSRFVEIIPMGSFPNLDEMLSLRNDFLSFDYFELEDRNEYIPFLSGGEDDMHLLKVSTGQIYYSSPNIQVYCEPVYRSLSSMLDFILECYKKNLLRIDPIEGLELSEEYWDAEEEYQSSSK